MCMKLKDAVNATGTMGRVYPSLPNLWLLQERGLISMTYALLQDCSYLIALGNTL